MAKFDFSRWEHRSVNHLQNNDIQLKLAISPAEGERNSKAIAGVTNI